MRPRLAGSLAVLVLVSLPLMAQRAAVTVADYARAEKFLGPNLQGLVVGGTVVPAWLPDERF